MKVDILGRTWKVTTQSPEAFTKRFGEEYAGVTLPTERQVFINTNELNLDTVVHELTHAYLASLCTSTASLTNDQNEEIYCELMATHGAHLLRLAVKLTKALKRES